MSIPEFTAAACVSFQKDHFRATLEHAGRAGLIEPASYSSCVKSCVDGNFDPHWCRCICTGRGVKFCGYGK